MTNPDAKLWTLRRCSVVFAACLAAVALALALAVWTIEVRPVGRALMHDDAAGLWVEPLDIPPAPGALPRSLRWRHRAKLSPLVPLDLREDRLRPSEKLEIPEDAELMVVYEPVSLWTLALWELRR